MDKKKTKPKKKRSHQLKCHNSFLSVLVWECCCRRVSGFLPVGHLVLQSVGQQHEKDSPPPALTPLFLPLSLPPSIRTPEQVSGV